MEKQQLHPLQNGWKRGDPLEDLLAREWLVTNGLGGYASGTIGGAATRRFHGKLIASLPAPLGRTMMLNHLEEWIVDPAGSQLALSGDAHGASRSVTFPAENFLGGFTLELGIPVWRYDNGAIRLEKRIVMPYSQNSTYIIYTLLDAPGPTALYLRPSMNFRPHEGLLNRAPAGEWRIDRSERRIEFTGAPEYPTLRLAVSGTDLEFEPDQRIIEGIIYSLEESRGYEHEGPLWSPGAIRISLEPGQTIAVIASVEPWDVISALDAAEALAADEARRCRLLEKPKCGRDDFTSQLVLAADQFLIRPSSRSADEARMAASGDTPGTVIAGYHWFTDWGRDTMISLEGLTLVTGRHREAGRILRTFASYIRNGLIPNMFPEGEQAGLYHTADATLWFFHAVARYVRWTGDRNMFRELLPKLVEIIDHHVEGTDFNIHVDPADGLLSQGADGYQLTWMDAKVDGWVVTPRRGKAVEINALFYNALRITEEFLREEGETNEAGRMQELAARARASFNERFWYEEGQYLYDVIDGEGAPFDPALRPNQLFALSLDHPVLQRDRWTKVVDIVERELLTPVGLRSLARSHPDYKATYYGDLRTRDAAYHQGTVWSWLIGPFIDAWMKVHDDRDRAVRFLDGFVQHLSEACIGTVSEVFDAEPPFTPRGCAAQAWGVAEVLRCLCMLRR